MRRSMQKYCAGCGGYIRNGNTVGYCFKTPECRKERRKIYDSGYSIENRKVGSKRSTLCLSCKESVIHSALGVCQKNPECKKQYQIIYESVYREQYGLYFVDRKNMWLEQGKVCYLCWEPLAFEDSHVDHDHTHKACNGNGCRSCVRGLTHERCNILIGHANDNEAKIHLIADNLQRVNKQIRSSWE